MSKIIDLTGRRFGRLVVLRLADDQTKTPQDTTARWLCRCNCGNVVVRSRKLLRSGCVNSCLPCGAVNVQFYWDEDEWKPYDRPEDGQIDGMMLDSDIDHIIEFIVYNEDGAEIFRASDYCEAKND